MRHQVSRIPICFFVVLDLHMGIAAFGASRQNGLGREQRIRGVELRCPTYRLATTRGTHEMDIEVVR
jgi:hypothetical protein